MSKELMLTKKITTFVAEDPANYWHNGLRFFDLPLIGFARADDPLFLEMKRPEICGELPLPRNYDFPFQYCLWLFTATMVSC